MKREDAISFCRYYKGEEKPPVKLNDGQANVWKIESYWVDMVTSEDDEVFRTILNQYLSANLRLFCRTDNVPRRHSDRFVFHTFSTCEDRVFFSNYHFFLSKKVFTTSEVIHLFSYYS